MFATDWVFEAARGLMDFAVAQLHSFPCGDIYFKFKQIKLFFFPNKKWPLNLNKIKRPLLLPYFQQASIIVTGKNRDKRRLRETDWPYFKGDRSLTGILHQRTRYSITKGILSCSGDADFVSASSSLAGWCHAFFLIVITEMEECRTPYISGGTRMWSSEMYSSHAVRKMEERRSRWLCESAACWLKLHFGGGASLMECDKPRRVTIKHPPWRGWIEGLLYR